VVALEVVSRLRDECFKAGRPVTLALSAFPRSTQPLLDKYLNKRLSEEDLQVAVSHWSKGRFEEMVPLLRYCRDSGVRLFACGVPPKILRTVQAGGVQALAPIDRQRYAPPLGGFPAPSPSASTDQLLATSPSSAASATAGLWGLEPAAVAAEVYSREAVSRTSLPFGPGPYWFAQARVVEQHAVARSIDQAMADGGIVGLLVVLTGASQVRYGAQGSGVPARINNGQLKTSAASQRVVLLNPERQRSRADGEMPEADFFWYSGSRMCTQNCFDRAEIARVMGAAGRTFDNLPQDLQTGIERGLISPDTLRSFFELESHPLVAEATKRFQGLRERVYADPRFLQRIVTEEAISLTTALLAQWEKRRDRFWSEIEYVATDVLRGVIVNFFTVWLPAPTLSFPAASAASSIAGSAAAGAAGAAGAAQGPVQQLVSGVGAWAATLPKNAFQRATQPGQDWGLQQRLASILFTSGKLFTVGFSASVGTISSFSVSESGESLPPAAQEPAPPTTRTLTETTNGSEGTDSAAALTDALLDTLQESDESVAAAVDRLMTTAPDSPLPLAALGLEIADAERSECGGARGITNEEILLDSVELSVPSSPPMGSVISLEHVTRVGDVELLPSLDSSIPLDSLDCLSPLESLPCLDSLPTLDSLPSIDSLASADSLEMLAVVPAVVSVDGPAGSVAAEAAAGMEVRWLRGSSRTRIGWSNGRRKGQLKPEAAG
ncbi:unnamed protein product, partial [Closterium sp. Naga37s-1]